MPTDASTIADGVTLDGEAGDRPQRAIVVYHRDGLQVVPLRQASPVVIGRTEPSDIQARSRRLSRRHARFELVDDAVLVEDLGSTNGTFLNGRRLEGRTRFLPGDEVTLGSVTVSVHAVGEAWLRPLGLEGHERFRGLLESEIERARAFERSVSVLMVRSGDPGSPKLGTWVPRLAELLRLVDRAALFAPDCVEILLPESDANKAAQTARDLLEQLREDGSPLLCGIASWPASSTADEVLEDARGAVMLASAVRPIVVQRRTPTSTPPPDGRPQPSKARAPTDPRHPGADAGPIVRDAATLALYRTVERIADSNISVLIVGETGTGKELLARAIHDQSDRAERPWRIINCGAIPASLIESTLFGHERGAFTGADQRKSGVFEEAESGTVFLDEIGELPPAAQVALLRVLETRRIQRVGSSSEIAVDVRVLAATHRDLEAMCKEGTFRWDLLYRLNPIMLRVPPLRERVGEIAPMVERFVTLSNRTNGRDVLDIHPEALAVLERYPWPGNVRELKNTIDRAVVIASGQTLTVEDLPERVLGNHDTFPRAPTEATTPGLAHHREEVSLDLKEVVRKHEIALIRTALHQAASNQTRAAELLQMPRRTLVYKMRAYDIRTGAALAELHSELDRRGRPLGFQDRVERLERSLISEAMARSNGDASAAARLLQIQKRTLITKLERFGLPVEPG